MYVQQAARGEARVFHGWLLTRGQRLALPVLGPRVGVVGRVGVGGLPRGRRRQLVPPLGERALQDHAPKVNLEEGLCSEGCVLGLCIRAVQ